MPLFYRKAYEAACRGNIPAQLTDAHFESWEMLEESLLLLPTDEQRCDAVYGNWLMRLNNPGGAQQWDLREHLTQGGGLDANYLAELAQNANDAADGNDAELRVKPEPGWLVVANNGRKVTPLNLIGLCDFFGHFALPIPGVRAIGKFGVGFKASFRIADEIFVYTWSGKSSFAFRIPITVPGRVASHPNKATCDRVLSQLSAVGVHVNPRFASVEYAGFCTPEYVAEPPPPIAAAIATLATTPHGTLFGYHLHEEGSQEIARRIETQTERIYELCPLFVPCLRIIELGSHRMAMSLGQEEEIATPAGRLRIAKATLSVGGPEGRQSHVRFWRLGGAEQGDKWQLALHADASFRLHLRRADDEQTTSVRDGSAYAFFPLHAVVWPLKLHLHLDLPTALSRGDWAHGNLAQSVAVKEQIKRAVGVMANWLAQRSDLWHPEWRVEALFEQTPTQDQEWARVLWLHLCETVRSVPLLRCLWGGQTTAQSRVVRIISRDEARAAWQTLGEALPQLRQICPLAEFVPQTSFGPAQLSAADVAELFEYVRPLLLEDARLRRAFVSAFLSCQAQTISNLERILGPLPIELASGSSMTFRELLEQPAGAELDSEWHTTLRQVAAWADQADWRNASAFGRSLRDKLRQLSQPQIYVTWAELPTRMADEQAWRTLGDLFWNTPRTSCPAAKLPSVAAAIRLPNGQGGWLLLSEAWLDDDSPVECFAGLLKPWSLPYQNGTRQRITGLHEEWGLFAEWERATKKMIEAKLPGELTRRLTEQASGDAFALVFNNAFEDARRPLEGGWAHVVNEAEKTAVTRFVHARVNDEHLSGKTVLSASIAATVRAALCLDAGFVLAPTWLTDAAYQRICRLGLQEQLGFEFLSQRDFDNEVEELSQKTLDGFHRWQGVEATELLLQGLETVFGKVPVNRRRDLFIALSTQRRRRVREFFAGRSPMPVDSSPGDRLMAARLDQAVKLVEPLPAPLDQIAALGSVAVHFGKLRCERETSSEVVLQIEQVDATVAQDADLKALVDQNIPLFGTAQGLRLKWFSGDDLVAELNDADVGWFSDRLVFGRYARPASEEQYVRLLSLYELSDVVSEDYSKTKRRGALPFDLYTQYREHIVEVLVKKHVKEVGYTKEHVLRELLQNSENAYGSKSERVSVPWFEFKVAVGTRPSERIIRLRHAGRAFNEPDRDGNPRPDTERIIKINAPNQNTELELGRFNRGFKSVFTVAKDGRVSVRSGRISFEILDLLLLIPPEPKEDKPPQAETEFEFTVSKDDALGMLGFHAVPAGTTPPGLLNPTSFIFLTQLRRVALQWEDKSWEWQVAWKQLGHGWVHVDIAEKTSSKVEAFWVHSGRLADQRRFGVAIRIGKDGEPKPLEKAWRTLRLTFETQSAFGFDVLVNGDFEVDPGRVALRALSTTGADIIEAALNASLERAKSQLAERFSSVRWVAWAKALHLKDAQEVFAVGFRDSSKRFDRWVERLEQQMTSKVPCSSGSLTLDHAVFPTKLMRRLMKDFAKSWGIRTDNWIEHEAEEELPARIREREAKFSLHKWLSEVPPMARILRIVQADLRQPAFETLKRSLGKPERDELAEAERTIQEKLRPILPSDERDEVVELPTIEEWSVEKLWQWWEQQEKPTDDYTLEGVENWRLLYADDPGDTHRRRERLAQELRATATDSGKRVWYRLFGLACLMSAGRRMTELREFWHHELDARQFWESTSGTAFGRGTDALFDDLMQRSFASLVASGEHAYFWRRVFYDFRKIHKLVWEDGFPDTLLRLAQAGRGGELLNFLKSGTLSGQKNWVGVFGQSAGTPLFFLVRELCRLRVITDPQVQPLAFFVSTPVRRAMERIGWLAAKSSESTDFESLSSISTHLHAKITSDREFGPKLLPDYDIPLLHLGLNG